VREAWHSAVDGTHQFAVFSLEPQPKDRSMSILATLKADYAAVKTKLVAVWDELPAPLRAHIDKFFADEFKTGLADLSSADQAVVNDVIALGENPSPGAALTAAMAVEEAIATARAEVPPGYVQAPPPAEPVAEPAAMS
jgi:hypothetical protein